MLVNFASISEVLTSDIGKLYATRKIRQIIEFDGFYNLKSVKISLYWVKFPTYIKQYPASS